MERKAVIMLQSTPEVRVHSKYSPQSRSLAGNLVSPELYAGVPTSLVVAKNKGLKNMILNDAQGYIYRIASQIPHRLTALGIPLASVGLHGR